MNIYERPEGLKIAAIFIVTIVGTSLVSRVMRSTELRVQGIEADEKAQEFLRAAAGTAVRIIANRPDRGDAAEYEHKLREASESHHLPPEERVLFLEVRPGDVSEFAHTLKVEGAEIAGHQVLRCTSPAIPNAIAALLLFCRDQTGKIPHAYFGWTEGNPIAYLLKFLAFGEGDTAPVTREVLRPGGARPLRRPGSTSGETTPSPPEPLGTSDTAASSTPWPFTFVTSNCRRPYRTESPTCRRAAEEREHQAADAVHILVLEVDVELLPDFVDAHRSLHAQAPLLVAIDRRCGRRPFLDLADHLLEQILERHDAGRAAVLVEHDRPSASARGAWCRARRRAPRSRASAEPGARATRRWSRRSGAARRMSLM